MHYTYIVNKIKERRETLNVTQEQLAELANVGLRTLKELERGKGNPTIETISKLADVLGLEVQLVVKGTNGK
jgi:transcriptional regulator with XRE-family HTH domain